MALGAGAVGEDVVEGDGLAEAAGGVEGEERAGEVGLEGGALAPSRGRLQKEVE